MATEKRRDDATPAGRPGGDAARQTGRRRSGVVLAAVLGAATLVLAAVLQAQAPLVVGSALLLAAVAVRRNAHRAVLSLLGVPVAARRLVDSVGIDTPEMEGAVIDRPVRTLLVLVFVAPFVTEDERVARCGETTEPR